MYINPNTFPTKPMQHQMLAGNMSYLSGAEFQPPKTYLVIKHSLSCGKPLTSLIWVNFITTSLRPH